MSAAHVVGDDADTVHFTLLLKMLSTSLHRGQGSGLAADVLTWLADH